MLLFLAAQPVVAFLLGTGTINVFFWLSFVSTQTETAAFFHFEEQLRALKPEGTLLKTIQIIDTYVVSTSDWNTVALLEASSLK